ncbi:hypothetical protein M1437_04240 [Patescibacteria group bacterium]|nr:hypothetical protein [Patescibacteria group bacterium]
MPKYSVYSLKEKGFSHILVLLGVVLAAGLIASVKIQTTKEFPSANVLGEAEEQQNEQQKRQAEQASESQKNIAEQQKESSKTKVETSVGNKQETETEGPNGQKIKTKVEDDGTTKVEIEHNKLKLKYVVEDGKVKVEIENEASKEARLSDQERQDVEDEVNNDIEKQGIKIGTRSGQPVIAKNHIAATTAFPLSIDATTKQLIVTTPAGQKIVTVLPDQAVRNLLATGIMTKIASQSGDLALTKDLGSLNGVVKLEIRDNNVVYKVAGIKEYRLFGFIPLSSPTTAFVSAQSGSLVAEDQPVIANLLKLLSPK